MWTQNFPKEVGWYWVRLPDGTFQVGRAMPGIHSYGADRIVFPTATEDIWHDDEDAKGTVWFCGPIGPPEFRKEIK